MRIARKLHLFVVMALAGIALTATPANAQLEILDEETGDHCTEVTIVNDHEVLGGCHIEVEGESHISLVVQTAGGPVTLMNCNWHFEGHVNEIGSGYIDEVLLTNEIPPSNPPCTRAPCDESADAVHHDHSELLWPMVFAEVSGVETVELSLCFRPVANPEGVGNTTCEIHLPWTDNGEHNYEIGSINGIYSCENLPPVSFRNVHLINEVDPHLGTEDVEMIH